MSKIISAINAMISRAEKISDVTEYNQWYFFVYKDAYKWSIYESNGKYYLNYYPQQCSIEKIVDSFRLSDWGAIVSVNYNTEDYKTKEALDSFQELYRIVQEKIYGVDIVLDNIINDMPF